MCGKSVSLNRQIKQIKATDKTSHYLSSKIVQLVHEKSLTLFRETKLSVAELH